MKPRDGPIFSLLDSYLCGGLHLLRGGLNLEVRPYYTTSGNAGKKPSYSSKATFRPVFMGAKSSADTKVKGRSDTNFKCGRKSTTVKISRIASGLEATIVMLRHFTFVSEENFVPIESGL